MNIEKYYELSKRKKKNNLIEICKILYKSITSFLLFFFFFSNLTFKAFILARLSFGFRNGPIHRCQKKKKKKTKKATKKVIKKCTCIYYTKWHATKKQIFMTEHPDYTTAAKNISFNTFNIIAVSLEMGYDIKLVLLHSVKSRYDSWPFFIAVKK